MRPLPINENNIILTSLSIQMSLLASINLYRHLENHKNWIVGTSKILLFIRIHKYQYIIMKITFDSLFCALSPYYWIFILRKSTKRN
jgi:hypothetical protein